MLQYYDFAAQASGAAFPVASPGRFIYYLSGSAGGADSTIAVRAGNTGQSVLLKPGQSVRLAAADKTVDTWFVSNYAKAQNIIGTVLVGDGFFDDNRISGSVEVIDGGKARTLGGSAFMGNAGSTAGATTYAHVQLWNPVGSGKNLIVEQVSMSAQSATSVYVGPYNASLANLVRNGLTKKVAQGATSVGELRAEARAANLSSEYMSMFVAANTIFAYAPKEPFIIPPGAGLHLNSGAPNVLIYGAFEWYEEGI